MIKIYDVAAAQQTILRRTSIREREYPPVVMERTAKLFGAGVTPPQAVAQILASVRDEGDAALRRWSTLLDGKAPQDFRIPAEALAAAYAGLSPSLAQALTRAAGRIRQFHKLQPLPDWETQALGGTLGQRVTPIERVGVYVPGGTAPLPSSLLMSVIPAQVAGVRQVIVCTPPEPHPTILAAAHLCGLPAVYRLGGAQAVAAMAYGTESIPKMDKIVGAGNLFVTLAKQQVYGIVGLDGLAGPTETVVIADGTANPAWVAADLLAQAEHDILASAILLTPDRKLAEAVQVEVGRQMESLSRAEIIAQSFAGQGGIVLTPDLETAAALADQYAPEHLCLAVADPQALARKINNSGGLFLGEGSFEVLGDYVAGPSHVMPTGGTARFASPLNVFDFVKINSIIGLDPDTSRELSSLAAEIARAESLTAHAAAAAFRAGARQDSRPVADGPSHV
ncbi:MAG TPA: histidinol dehydrogenase [Anaerolineales bacterium]